VDLDASTARALKDLERIAIFNRELQRTGTVRDGPPAEPANQPERWGHLMLLERVGAGAQGEVWRVWDATLQRQVALKFLQAEAGPGAPSSNLVTEARALARIRHPGVVAVHGIAEHDGRTGMWMEWIEGLTLAREMERRGALPAREVARIGIELCSALEALESAGVIHRDVKPANIVLETTGRVVLTDFGLGWRGALDGANQGPLSGTPVFMAPDILGGGEPSPRSDIYALGVTLWWALAGRSPFRSRSLADLREEAARGPSTPLRSVRRGAPGALADAIEWAMEPEDSQRPRSAAHLRQRLALSYPGDATAGTWMSRVLAGGGVWWKVGLAALAVAGLSWWIASAIHPAEVATTRWKARQVAMPPEIALNSDYSLAPDGTRIAYVSDSSAALSIFSIDTNDTHVVDRLAKGEGAYSNVGWTLDGSRLVTSRCDASGEGTVLLVDPLTGHRDVLARLGRLGPSQVASMQASLSPDGRFVVVRSDFRPASELFRALEIIDVRSGRVLTLARAADDRFISPPAWDPSGTRLSYVLSGEDLKYSRIETCDLRGTRTTVVVDSAGGLVPFGADFRTLLWLDGKRLLYAMRRPGRAGESDWRMVQVDRRGHPSGRPRLVYALDGARVVAPSLSRNGSIAFVGKRHLRRLELAGVDGKPRYPRLTQGVLLSGLVSPTWSMDGTTLFVRSDENAARSSIGRIALSTGRFEAIAAATPPDRPLCPTPDGRELLCSMDSRLVALPVMGGAPRVLSKSFVGVVLYAPRADRWVAVEHVRSDLVVRDFSPSTGAGSVRFRYPAPGLPEGVAPTADVSPDGERIVVLRGDSSGYDILESESGRVVRRVDMAARSNPQSVRWSPDGATLYATGLGGMSSYWIARLDPNGDQRLIWKSDDTWPGSLAISPDGTTLAFTSLRFSSELWILERS
jgi:Tol biopolymer transport system component